MKKVKKKFLLKKYPYLNFSEMEEDENKILVICNLCNYAFITTVEKSGICPNCNKECWIDIFDYKIIED